MKDDLRTMFNRVCADAINAYIDTVIFIMGIKCSYPDNGCHLYRYSFYSIRQRTILSVKKLIEPSGKDKININTIIKQLDKNSDLFKDRFPSWKADMDFLSKTYEELIESDAAKRLKVFRDSICHNTEENAEIMVYCKDLMRATKFVLDVLSYVYFVLYEKDADFLLEVRNMAHILAHDYWDGLYAAVKQTEPRHAMVNRLQDILDGNFEKQVK